MGSTRRHFLTLFLAVLLWSATGTGLRAQQFRPPIEIPPVDLDYTDCRLVELTDRVVAFKPPVLDEAEYCRAFHEQVDAGLKFLAAGGDPEVIRKAMEEDDGGSEEEEEEKPTTLNDGGAKGPDQTAEGRRQEADEDAPPTHAAAAAPEPGGDEVKAQESAGESTVRKRPVPKWFGTLVVLPGPPEKRAATPAQEKRDRNGYVERGLGVYFLYCGTRKYCGTEYQVLLRYSVVTDELTGLDDWNEEELVTESHAFTPVEEPEERSSVPVWKAQAAAQGQPRHCFPAARKGSVPGTFFVLDGEDLVSARVEQVKEIKDIDKLVVCGRYGDHFLTAYLERNSWLYGLVPADQVEPTGGVLEGTHVHHRQRGYGALLWDGETTRITYLYGLDFNDGSLKPMDFLSKGDPVSVLSQVPGPGGDNWYRVRAFGAWGFLPPDTIRFDGASTFWNPPTPRRTSYEILDLAILTCDASLVPEEWLSPATVNGALPASISVHATADQPMTFPVIRRHEAEWILAFDALAPIPAAREGCMMRRFNETLLPELLPHQMLRSIVLDTCDVKTGTCRLRRTLDCETNKDCRKGVHAAPSVFLATSWSVLPDRRPSAPPSPQGRVESIIDRLRKGSDPSALIERHRDWFPTGGVSPEDMNQLVRAGADRTLVMALHLGAGVPFGAEDTVRKALDALCSEETRGDLPDAPLVEWLTSQQTSGGSAEVRRTAKLLLAEDYAGALASLASCNDQACPSPTEDLLLADALRGLGYYVLGREICLRVVDRVRAGQPNLLAAAVEGYNRAAEVAGHEKRAQEVFLEVCQGSSAAESLVSVCVTGGQVALEFGNLPQARKIVDRLSDLRAEGVYVDELRARVALLERSEHALALYSKAVQNLGGRCFMGSEFLQRMLLQLGRVAFQHDILPFEQVIPEYMTDLTLYLLPETILEDYQLVLSILGNIGRVGGKERRRFEEAGRVLDLAACSLPEGTTDPELPLAFGHLLLERCQFQRVAAAFREMERRLVLLRAVQEEFDRERSAGGGRRQVIDALNALDRILARHCVSSRQIPEFDSVMQREGACGRWNEVRRELDELSGLGTVRPDMTGAAWSLHLQEQLEREGRACVAGLREANVGLDERLQFLRDELTQRRDDIGRRMDEVMRRCYMGIKEVMEAAQGNFCDDLGRWRRGEDPSWLDSVSGMSIPYAPVCLADIPSPTGAEDKETLAILEAFRNMESDQLPEELRRYLGGGDVREEADWDLISQWVERWVQAEVDALLASKRSGTSDEGLLLMAHRYLPALRVLKPQEAFRLPMHLPRSVRMLLGDFTSNSEQQIMIRLKTFLE